MCPPATHVIPHQIRPDPERERGKTELRFERPPHRPDPEERFLDAVVRHFNLPGSHQELPEEDRLITLEEDAECLRVGVADPFDKKCINGWI